MQISDNIRGALLMMGSMVAFTVNDAFMKALSDELPLFQALLLRGFGTVICLTVLCAAMGQLQFNLGRRSWGLIALRTVAEVASAYFFLTALYHMPLANVSAILQALPLTVSLAAAVFLGEALGWRRLVAILIGFAGVFLIIKPEAGGFSLYSLYALAAVAFVTLRDLVVRRMDHAVPSVLVGLVAALAVTVFAAVMCIGTPWVQVTWLAGWQVVGAMAAIMFGYVFSVTAMRHGEIGFVAQFRYASLVAALILGWVVFDEWPAPLMLVGAGIVVATGLFTLYRERRFARRSMLGRLS